MSNPYDDEENPFADAAVLEAAGEEIREEEERGGEKGKKGSSKKSGKGGDGEFSDSAGLFKGQSSSSSSSSPAPPPYTAPPVANLPPTPQDEAIKERERELRRQEEMLANRERELERQAQMATGGKRAPNWPVCYPYFVHDIKLEIPVEHQIFIRNNYYSWIYQGICLGINIIACLCILIAGLGGKDFGFSIMYLVFIVPLSFLLWYRPLYNAYMKDTSFYFVSYLFFGGCNLLFELYIIMGGPETGASGFINTIDLYAKKHWGEAAICTISLIMWSILFGYHVYIFRIVYLTFRGRGHSFKEAGTQAVSSAARSEVGREAMKTAATGAIQGMASGPN